MKMVPLGEIASLGSGGTPKRSVSSYFGNDYPWLSIADLNDDFVTDAKEGLTTEGLNNSSAKLVAVGSILIAMYGSIGKLGIAQVELCTSQAIAFATPNPDIVDRRYLFHFLLSERSSLQRRGRGGTQQNISQGDLKAWRVPLPPLDEQRRIAAILDRADAIRQKCRQTIDRLQLVAQSTFKQLTNSTTSRAGLGELGLDFTSGKNVIGAAQNTHPVNRILKVNAISSGTFKPDEIKPMPADYSPPKKHAVQKGDVLFGRASGSLDLLGVTAIVDQQIDNLYLPDKVWKLNIKDPRTIDPGYALGVLRSDGFKSYVRHNASGAAGVKNISRSKVLKYQAPVANAIDQQNFSAIAIRVQHTLVRMNTKTNAGDALFASLQARAFRGEL